MSERHREALAHLLYGVAGPHGAAGGTGGGFVLLTGDIGTGKTTICRCFLEQIPAGCHVAYIFNPKLTVTELLQSVCEEFHIAVAAAAAPPRPRSRTTSTRSTPSCCRATPPGKAACSSSTRRRTSAPTCWSSCAC